MPQWHEVSFYFVDMVRVVLIDDVLTAYGMSVTRLFTMPR